MTWMRVLPLLLFAGACSQGSQTASHEAGAPANAAAEVSVAGDQAADNALGAIVEADPSPTPTPNASPTPSTEVSAKAFPAAFRGRWGLVAADCDPKRDDNKGLMTVAADRLTFYESRATPSAITVASPTRITARLDWSGEGQTWQTSTDLRLEKNGTQLVRTSTDEGDLTYSKCAG